MTPERQVWQSQPRIEPACTVCRDFGYVHYEGRFHFCSSCEAGAQAKREWPAFLDLLNEKPTEPPARVGSEPRPAITEADIELAMEIELLRRRENVDNRIADARAILASGDATRDQKEIAREILRGLGVD